jgi:hypothetical protein
MGLLKLPIVTQWEMLEKRKRFLKKNLRFFYGIREYPNNYLLVASM